MLEFFQKAAEDPKQDAIKNPKHPRELCLENFWIPFMVTYIKELKCEYLQFLIPPEVDQLISSWRLPRNAHDNLDFSRLTAQQYIAFRHAFVEQRMYNPTYVANKGHKAMDMVLTVICMVLCNRVPKGAVSFRTDGLAAKIKLVMPPRGVEVRTRVGVEKTNVTPDNPKGTEQEVVIEKNTNEKAVVRI